ncbi:hypothetical protein B9Z55_018531 [Caenorhabditis nigoni]|nr:hypothetical protein B9Z55_018531 [Caenorhabditis nigoni]
MIGRRWRRGGFLLFVSISSIFLFVLVECKPPKSLNRMRQNKGTYNAAAFNSPSMINNGLLLADFDHNGTSREARESYEEYKDDIDHLLEEDLTFYDEGADTAAGDVEIKPEPVIVKQKEVQFEKPEDVVEEEEEEEEQDVGEENGGETEEYEEEEEEETQVVEEATTTITTTTTETPTTTTTAEEVQEPEEEEEDVK